MQIKPTNSNVFFTLHDAKTSSLDPIDENHDRKFICPYGRVVAVGVEVPGIIPGARIIINPHACTKLPTELGDLFVCPASAIYGVYSGEPEPAITLN